MSLSEFLAELNACGVRLWLEQDTLHYSAPAPGLSHGQSSKLAAAKPEIIELIRKTSVHAVSAAARAPRTRPETSPLTFEQQRIWRSTRIDPASAAFNICGQAQLSGPLNVAALEQALREIVRRHDILRSRIAGPDDRCVLAVAADGAIALPLVDLTEIGDADSAFRSICTAEGRRLFDLRHDLLLRVTLVRCSDRRHVLILTVHHLIFDHWSVQVLTREMHALYAAYSRGQVSGLTELREQFSRYALAEWERLNNSGFDPGLGFWERQLHGLKPTEFPTHPLMFRAEDQAAVWREDLGGATLARLRAVARSREVGLPVVLMTALFALLRQYLDQDDVAVGTTIIQRAHPDFEPLIGLLINTIVLRCDLSLDPTLGELLTRMKRSWNDSVAHSDVPFQLVLDRLRPGQPGKLFNVGVEIRLAAAAIESAADLIVTPVESHFVSPMRDLTLFLEEAVDHLTVRFEYRRAAFSSETIRQLSRRLTDLLRTFSQCWSNPISALRIEDKPKSASSATTPVAAEIPMPIESVLQQARRTPDAIALEAVLPDGEPTALTYAALELSVIALARALHARIQPEALIAIQLLDPLRSRVAALGVMRAGGAFLVLDPRRSQEQIAHTWSTLPVAAILTERSCVDRSHSALPVWVWEDLCSHPTEDPLRALPVPHARSLACVQVLAGPKHEAVASEHRSLALSLRSLRSCVRNEDFARMLSMATWGFESSLFELFMPLMCGGTVVLVEDGPRLSAAIHAAKPTGLHAAPSVLDELLRADAMPPSLRAVYISGDVLYGDTLNLLFSRSGIERVVTCYGRTEAACFQSCAVVSRPECTGVASAASAREPSVQAQEHARLGDVNEPTAPSILSERDRQIIAGFNATEAAYPHDRLVHQMFEQQAQVTPDAVAVLCEKQSLTYAELNRKANQLARYLRRQDIGPDRLVGICVERSLEMVIGLLGILKAGGAYVPLDPNYPVERLAYMLHDAAPQVVLVQQRLRERLGRIAGKVVALDDEWSEIAGLDAGNLDTGSVGSRSDQLAYVIYTSGSTGAPKGAMNEHKAVLNRLQWMQDQYGLDASDRVLQKTPFSFDVSVWEFFWPLMTGARLIMARPEGHKDPAYLRQLVEQTGVTRLHFVPSMLQMFLEPLPPGTCRTVRQIVCSGEELSPTLQNKCLRLLPHARLSNLYGPTEAAVDVTFWECQFEERSTRVPIGQPIANLRMYVLDRNSQPVPIGAAGEIHIGGVGVGRGYLNRPELTAERFVIDPFSSDPQGRMYKTGDLGRWRADGAIEYLGRNDDQVKVRGHRIELGEIESQLLRHEQVREAVVLARAEGAGEKRLVAYVTSASEKAPSVDELRMHLKGKLPEYMRPAAYVVMEKLPLTPNGKVDKRSLPEPSALAHRRGRQAAPSIASIGQPLDGAGIQLLRRGLDCAPMGIMGQIAIAGPWLARGYVGRADLTAARFQPDPAAPVPGARRFLTGDRGCVGRDGSLYCLGRLDEVTSLHGGHIDLLEIEAVLRTHIRVRAAATSIATDASGQQALLAQVVLVGGEQFDIEADLRDHVARTLPPHMVPESIVRVHALPLKDGKLDRKALSAVVSRQPRAAQTQTERTLTAIWGEVLRATPVNLERSFLDLGGDSVNLLTAARLTSERLGQQVTATDMLRYVSIRSLAHHLDSRGEQRSEGTSLVRQRAGARLKAVQSTAARARGTQS